jgi:putative ABC transport system permease protein
MQKTASFGEAVKVAGQSLRSNKLRTFLTLLGVILATTTLIAVMSIIHGMDVYIAEQVSDMGADGFRIFRMAFVGDFDPKKFMEMQRKNPQLSKLEYQFVRDHATMIRQLGMQTFRRVRVNHKGAGLDDCALQGVTSNMGVIMNLQATTGRFISPVDDQNHRLVAFIGSDVKERFFPNSDPVGKTIEIQGLPFEVIGVSKTLGSVFGQSRDQFVMIPVETYFKIYTSRTGISYFALALNQGMLMQAQDEMRMLLRAYRHLRPNQDDNFSIVSSDSLSQAWAQLTGAIAATALAVVSVFMVVGGVVIMNIMLAAVTERTHEIGIRKSVGARNWDIMSQFLVESAMMSGAGGVAGVMISYGIVLIVRATTPMPMAMPLMAILVGVLLSMSVGLFFGIYPARRAARLDPIEALRVEK